ncbi:MAG: hypothetical protein HYU58_21070 [Proteobacteria bacterium]|nr:hypothetical protein [Pseudomonadota bacterium]
MIRAKYPAVLIAAIGLTLAWPAMAHTGESGLVLLLPTGYFVLGGASAVLVSFALVFLWPPAHLQHLWSKGCFLGTVRRPSQTAVSTVTFIFLAALILAGLFGSRDPRANPLPVTIWAVWWGSFVFVQAICGDLWHFLNPAIAPARALRRFIGATEPLLAYPAWLGCTPAIVLFGGFAWLELIDLAPDDPARLAHFVLAYFTVAMAGMVLFGERAWLARGDPFTIFLRLLAHLSPVDPRPIPNDPARRQIFLVFPGARLFQLEALSLSGTAFLLMTLGSVSFDGLSRTFRWLEWIGINPLEFPGRSAVVTGNSVGLFGLWLAIVAAYAASILLGRIVSGSWRLKDAAGTLVISIIPITLAYHFAHYLTSLILELQYVVEIYGDPLAQGWNPLDLPANFVSASLLNNYSAVAVIWTLQAGAVVIGHIVAVAVAHLLNARMAGSGTRAALAQVPLAALMVLYTLFGLWLLAAPNIG